MSSFAATRRAPSSRYVLLHVVLLPVMGIGCNNLVLDAPVVPAESANIDDRLNGIWIDSGKKSGTQADRVVLHFGTIEDNENLTDLVDNLDVGSDSEIPLELVPGTYTFVVIIVHKKSGPLAAPRLAALNWKTDKGGWLSLPVRQEHEEQEGIWYQLWRYKLVDDQLHIWRIVKKDRWLAALADGRLTCTVENFGNDDIHISDFDTAQMQNFLRDHGDELNDGDPVKFVRLSLPDDDGTD